MLRLRVPDRFTLLGREWTVTRPETVTVDGNPCCKGSCQEATRSIEIVASAVGEFALEVFAHEITHAGLGHLQLPHHTEEQVCQTMEMVILDALRAMVEVEAQHEEG